MNDLPRDIIWRRSSRCEGGACVEIADLNDAIAVRSSADPGHHVLLFTRREWTAFIGAVKLGEFDS